VKVVQEKEQNVKKENAAVPNKDNLRAITQMEAQMFQQLIQISNQYAKLKQQKQEFEIVLTQVKKRENKLLKERFPYQYSYLSERIRCINAAIRKRFSLI